MPNLKQESRIQQTSKRVTLLDVANASGLSRATVSLVLRDSPLVAEGTRKRVQEVMRDLGYVYHRSAANLRAQKSHTVGLVVSDITNPFFAEMTMSIEAQLDRANYVSLLFNTSEMLSKQEQLLSTMQEYSADGILLCPARGTPLATIEKLQRSRLPFVLFARYLPGIEADYVGADNIVGARVAVEHLISLGHRKIAFIGGPLNISSRKEREQGWRQAQTDHDLPINESFVVTTSSTREGGFEAAHRDPSVGQVQPVLATPFELESLGGIADQGYVELPFTALVAAPGQRKHDAITVPIDVGPIQHLVVDLPD